jgi:hypothetical protein
VVVLIILLIGSCLFLINRHSGFDITIKNNTSETISGLNITYEGIAKDIGIPNIATHEEYEININPKESFSESSMIIYYADKRNYIQKNVLIGYFEKGYRGDVEVNINSQDENGLIIMQIQER